MSGRRRRPPGSAIDSSAFFVPSSERFIFSTSITFDELVVEQLDLGDEGEVLLLDRLDLDDHLVDRLADGRQVGVDPVEVALRRRDLRVEIGLHRVDLGDLRPSGP